MLTSLLVLVIRVISAHWRHPDHVFQLLPLGLCILWPPPYSFGWAWCNPAFHPVFLSQDHWYAVHRGTGPFQRAHPVPRQEDPARPQEAPLVSERGKRRLHLRVPPSRQQGEAAVEFHLTRGGEQGAARLTHKGCDQGCQMLTSETVNC